MQKGGFGLSRPLVIRCSIEAGGWAMAGAEGPETLLVRATAAVVAQWRCCGCWMMVGP